VTKTPRTVVASSDLHDTREKAMVGPQALAALER